MSHRNFMALALGLGLISGCGEDEMIRINLCGNLLVPEEVDSVRVILADDEFNEIRGGVIRFIDQSMTTDPPPDASDDGGSDASRSDATVDGGGDEDGGPDGGPADGGPADGGPADGGEADGGPADGGSTDGGLTDAASLDGGGESEMDAGPLPTRRLPTHTVLPRPSGPGWVRILVLRRGVELMRSDRRVDDFAGLSSVDMLLTADCLPVDCALGQSCIAGRCELAPGPRDEPSCSGAPPSRDAGTLDAPDALVDDGGMQDASDGGDASTDEDGGA